MSFQRTKKHIKRKKYKDAKKAKFHGASFYLYYKAGYMGGRK